MELTQEYLKSILDYNPNTGIFTWKLKKAARIIIGSIAGTRRKDGYIHIQIDGKNYLGHRLAFLFMTGAIPSKVDHKDLDTSNNIWSNLRNASNSQNGANRLKLSNNGSGYKNVTWQKSASKWKVVVHKNGKDHYAGLFTELKDAVETANKLRKELFGEFATYEEYKQ